MSEHSPAALVDIAEREMVRRIRLVHADPENEELIRQAQIATEVRWRFERDRIAVLRGQGEAQ